MRRFASRSPFSMRFASVTSSAAVSSLCRPTSARKSCRLSPAPVDGPAAVDDRAAASSAGRADLEADRLELVGHLGHLLVAEIELERERLELSGLDVAALLGALEEVATCLGVKQLRARSSDSRLFSMSFRQITAGWIAAHPHKRSHSMTHSLGGLPERGALNRGLTQHAVLLRLLRRRGGPKCWRFLTRGRRSRPRPLGSGWRPRLPRPLLVELDAPLAVLALLERELGAERPARAAPEAA